MVWRKSTLQHLQVTKSFFLKWLRKKVFSEFYTQLAYDLALKTQGCDSDRLIMLGKKIRKEQVLEGVET